MDQDENRSDVLRLTRVRLNVVEENEGAFYRDPTAKRLSRSRLYSKQG